MIRFRLKALEAAVGRAIETARVSQEAAVVDTLLKVIGRATEAQRTTYWALDLARIRLRPIASWSAVTLSPSAPHRGLTYLTALRCRTNAVRVLRSRKPLWSTNLVLDATGQSPGALQLGGGAWFAVRSDTFVYGVVEILGLALKQSAPTSLVVLERLGFRLGLAFEQLCHGDLPRH
jgi:hypothetical protein